MYDSFAAFKSDALACGTRYYPDSSLQPEKIEAAYKIYRNASKGTQLLDAEGNTVDFGVSIVGRLALKIRRTEENGREEYVWLPADESFPSIDKIMQENLKTLNEDSDRAGSILDAKSWSLLGNDAWLLGGIHAKTEFHFASPLAWSNLWDGDGERMTVTAREAIGITAHGYEIIRPNPKLEAVAICVDERKATGASLGTYKEHVQRYSSYDALRQFFGTLCASATRYP